MASYTTQRMAFVFSMVSNAGSAATSDFAGAITSKFNDVTQTKYSSFIGTGWSIVWGPEVYVPNPSNPHAANALLVVQGSDASGSPLYIVATAGTNGKSLLEEVIEDLDVALVPFGPGGQITLGTSDGVQILMGLQSNNQTISEFLANNASSSAMLVFTGHSLGGALTPALALSIDTSGWGQVYAMPTAGPTPGDQTFVNAFTAKFPTPPNHTDPLSTWNCNIVNTLDLVPMAWTSLSGILGLYPQIGSTTCLTNLVNAAAGIVPSPNPFTDLPQVPFDGTFAAPAVPECLLLQEATVQFLGEALYQHSTGYVQKLVGDFSSEFPGLVLQPGACGTLTNLCAAVSTDKAAPDGVKAKR
ncbi:MAG TPA: hypothetical protein VG106_07270 [Vicinamibacterales bacterium]|nr:hypothetical protein [Vicinamibacterales bacterium]